MKENMHLKIWTFVFRFCDSVWQLLLKNVEFLTVSGQSIAKVDGKVRQAKYIHYTIHILFVICNRLKLWHVTPGNLKTKDNQKQETSVKRFLQNRNLQCKLQSSNQSFSWNIKVTIVLLYSFFIIQCLCTFNLKREINIWKIKK